MFDVGDLLLYLALSQFLSSGLNNMVHGLRITLASHLAAKPIANSVLSIIIRGLPLLLWWFLVFGAPLKKIFTLTPRRNLLIAYAIGVFIIFFSSSLSFYLRDTNNAGFGTLVKWSLAQFAQPLFW